MFKYTSSFTDLLTTSNDLWTVDAGVTGVVSISGHLARLTSELGQQSRLMTLASKWGLSDRPRWRQTGIWHDETGYEMMKKVYHDASQPFQVAFSLFGDDGNVYDFIHSHYRISRSQTIWMLWMA